MKSHKLYPNAQPIAPLNESKNMMVQDFVRLDNYRFTAEASRLKDYPHKLILGSKSLFWEDFVRNLQMHGKTYEQFTTEEKVIVAKGMADRLTISNKIQTDYDKNNFDEKIWAEYANLEHAVALRQFLANKFPGEFNGKPYCDLIVEHWSQAPISFSSAVIETIALANGYHLVQPAGVPNKRQVNLYSEMKEGKNNVYLQVVDREFKLGNLDTGTEIVIPGTILTYQVTDLGYAYCPQKSFALGHEAADLFLGISKIFLPGNKEEEKSENNLSSFDDNLIDGLIEPVKNPQFANRMTLVQSIADGYDSIFKNENDETRVARLGTVISWPFKLVGEFGPRFVRCLGKWAADHIVDQFFSDEHYISNPLLRYPTKILAGGFLLAFRLIEGAGQLTELVMARITSPIRSYEEAKKIHPALGALSALVTVAGTMTVAILAAPLLPAIGLAGAAAWVVGHTGAVGPLFSALASQLTAAIGMSVSSAAVGFSAMLGSLYTFVMLPLHNLANKFIQPEKNVDVIYEEIAISAQKNNHVGSSNSLVNNKLSQHPVANSKDDGFVLVGSDGEEEGLVEHNQVNMTPQTIVENNISSISPKRM